MREDPVPLASLAAELMRRAAAQLPPDEDMVHLLHELSAALPVLRMDESHLAPRRRPTAAAGAAAP